MMAVGGRIVRRDKDTGEGGPQAAPAQPGHAGSACVGGAEGAAGPAARRPGSLPGSLGGKGCPFPAPAFLPVCGLTPALQAGPPREGVQKGQRSGRSPRRRSRRCGRRPQKPPAGRFWLCPYPLPHPAIPLFAKSACEGGGYLL